MPLASQMPLASGPTPPGSSGSENASANAKSGVWTANKTAAHFDTFRETPKGHADHNRADRSDQSRGIQQSGGRRLEERGEWHVHHRRVARRE